MRDFKRIGGEILSSPLNENFRKLRNDISIANSNLVFSDKYGIMPNIGDMEDLKTNPEVQLTEGQVCYVVSSGELYRYSELDEKWHKYLMDFYISGLTSIVLDWVYDDCKIPVQEVSDFIKGLIVKK